ncbi:MAG: outer membrane beta-barrel protein [Saprospiraceae bacterium]|jgi:outer membrane protein OmpA-like peptidoglycan-associated protein|nr:outer membrane beta-barrel protein [Saprospiraceae bacterium]
MIHILKSKQKKSCQAWFLPIGSLKSLLFIASFLTIFQANVEAQVQTYARPSWLFGVAAGANVNMYRGSTQQMNDGFRSPVTFHDGAGVGLFVAPLVEYMFPDSRFGIMLQAGYDGKNSAFDQKSTVCNCAADLKTNLSYLTVEPSIRFAPFNGNFYLFGGPRFAFNLQKDFTYELGLNPEFPDQLPTPDVKGEFSNIHETLVSMQIGAGYDIPLSSQNVALQSFLSPFISFQPYFGQSPRSIETWNITTVRVGAALKFGFGAPEPMATGSGESNLFDAGIRFYVNSPENIPSERRMRETFPVLNYVFFDLGSTEIPSRYISLKKNQVSDFKEDQLEVYAPKDLTGRADRGMHVYYNVLNILGDRLDKNPSATINLVGSSEKGQEDGMSMATSVKKYLVDVFGINNSRISVEGRDKPKLPSEKPGSTVDLEMLRAGDRRVSIESSSPELLMEFQTGKGAAMKPVVRNGIQTAPFDSYVSFHVDGAEKSLQSWKVELKDKKNKYQSFGPFTKDVAYIAGKSILGVNPEGDYKATMVGQTKNGMTVTREVPVHMTLWTPTKDEQGIRYSVVYEFDASKAATLYEKYLTEIVAPQIPQGGTVIIHGHTDIIGDEAYNKTLSMARANDVKQILSSALTKSGRSDVKFNTYGSGEDESLTPFDNKLPEERFYNRTVIIDIIPKK